MLFIIATTIMSYRLVVIPSEEMLIDDLPWWSVYSILILISVVAGVAEESGFRGYMQAPLEKRYGPVVAIGPSYLWEPLQLKETGLDGFFWVVLAVIVVTGMEGALLLGKLRRLTAEGERA